MEKELIVAVITGVFSIVGVISGILGTYLVQSKTEKRKYKFEKIKETYNQFVTLCKLEELYVSEITELRNKAGKECKEKGVQDEFRHKVYAAGEARITESASRIKAIADKM